MEDKKKKVNDDSKKETKKIDKEIDDLDKNIDELEKTINDLELKASSIYDEENLDSSSIEKKLNKKSNLKIYELIIIGFFISFASILLTKVVINHNDNNYGDENVTKTDSIEEFEEVYKLIKNSYYKKVNDSKLIDGAIEGMLSSLDDPHTSYFNETETENFNEIMNGSYKGIGAEISVDSENNIIILSVFKNSPAYEVGLKYNDKILEVNGKSTKGLTTTEVVALIKDDSKKEANIKINRDGKELSFEVEKRIVTIESVVSKTFNKNGKKIGYILINNFANNTYDQFKKQVVALESKNISGLVIDVRDNSGGYLHSVTDMLDMFISKGTVMYKIQDQKETTLYKSTTSEYRNYPIAILVNKSSASASEILAISLKEAYGAFVVGVNTFGKGTVQTTKDLPTGGMIKYTIQKWLSPKGNWVDKVGVEPTNKVELSEEFNKNPSDENDNQLQSALDIVSK